MADNNVFYFRTDRDMRPVHFPSFVEVAKVLLEIDGKTLQSLVSDLQEYQGFLGRAGLKQLIGRHVKDVDKAESIARLIVWTDLYIRPGTTDRFFEELAAWQAGSEENHNPELLSAVELPVLQQAISVLAQPFPARARQVKAERLAEATGLLVEAIDLICDLRPVFDETRSKIEGLIPFTTLRVVAASVDKFPVAFEALLSARDVELLAKKAEDAVRKLNAIGQLAERDRLPVPAVSLTETSR
jgi:hypothetical protein